MHPLYKLLNWYTERFPFPKRGWKYVQPLLQFFHLSGKIYKKKLFNGLYMHVNATDHIQKNIFWYGEYEKEASCLWQCLLKTDSVVLDIGANIGYFTLLAAAKARSGKVFSFEPVSFFRKQLKKNLALNGFRNIDVLPLAVSDRNEETDIYLAADDNLGMTSLTPPENFSGEKEKVKTIRLDAWLKAQHLSKIDFIKIDVEGAEKKVLDGMKEMLQIHQPVLFLEVVNTLLSGFGHSAKEIYSTLSEYNYQPYEIRENCSLKQITECIEGYNILFLPNHYRIPQAIKIDS